MAGKVAGDGVPGLDEQAMLDADVGKQAVLDLDETAVWEPRDQMSQDKTVVDQARQDQAKVQQPRAAKRLGTWLLQVVEVVALMAALMVGPAQSLQKKRGGWSNPLGPPVETEDHWMDQSDPVVCCKKCCKSWWSALGNQERPESRHCSHLSTAH